MKVKHEKKLKEIKDMKTPNEVSFLHWLLQSVFCKNEAKRKEIKEHLRIK